MEIALPPGSDYDRRGFIGQNHVVQFYESEAFLCDAARADPPSRRRHERSLLETDGAHAIISPELRTPLHAMFGWSHIGSENGADDATRRRALEVIQRNARLQLHIVDPGLGQGATFTVGLPLFGLAGEDDRGH